MRARGRSSSTAAGAIASLLVLLADVIPNVVGEATAIVAILVNVLVVDVAVVLMVVVTTPHPREPRLLAHLPGGGRREERVSAKGRMFPQGQPRVSDFGR